MLLPWKHNTLFALLNLAAAVSFVEGIEVRYVNTPVELQAAVSDNARHIVIQNHLDLRNLTADSRSGIGALLFIGAVKSMRGDCQSVELPASFNIGELPPSSQWQCVLLTAAPLLELNGVSSELLFTDIYVQISRTPNQQQRLVELITVTKGEVWASQCTFYGDGAAARAVLLRVGQLMYARSCFFIGFQANNSAAVKVEAGGRIGLKDCNFNQNSVTQHGSAVGISSGDLRETPAAMWFHTCTFSKNVDPLQYPVSQSNRRAIHLNNRYFQKSVDVSNGGLIVPGELDATRMEKAGFLISRADNFREIAREQTSLTNLQAVEVELLEDSESSKGGAGRIVAIACGAAAAFLVVVAAAAIFLVVRRRSRRKEAALSRTSTHPAHTLPTMGAQSLANSHTSDPMNSNVQGRSPSKQSRDYGRSPGTSIKSGPSQVYHSNGASLTEASHLQALEATNGRESTFVSGPSRMTSTAGKKMDREALEEALDDIFERRILFLGRFELYSQVHRRVGGQGLVQPARGRFDEEEYAIKFFFNPHTFNREEALYLREDLRLMMPAVKEIVPNGDGGIVDTVGRMFPPAIVIERGEPLDEWALRIEPDFPTILTVLCHILARLQQLHSVGLAHRDLKPGNVLWRPKHFSWTLIDFGCAAEIGQTCPLSLSLLYAAPESVWSLEAGVKTTVADPAVDMWALGVISYELLTASRAFPRSLGPSEVRSALAGRSPLPWETSDFKKKPLPQLRMLRRTVLSCLNRNPARRPTSNELLTSWNGLFDAATKGKTTDDIDVGTEPDSSRWS